jgi:hypothetical protein
MRLSAVLAVLTISLSASLSAADEPLPAPTPLPPQPPYIIVQPLMRTSRYAVWQNYGVDRQGIFRPRVLYTPDGAFYTIDGRPYPWLTTHPLYWMPYASD